MYSWKKPQYDFPKMRGGGSKAIWNFSEKTSVLVGPSVPYLEYISNLTDFVFSYVVLFPITLIHYFCTFPLFSSIFLAFTRSLYSILLKCIVLQSRMFSSSQISLARPPLLFLVSPDALEVIVVTDSLSVSTDLTDVTLVNDDTYWRLDWCYSSNWGYWWRWWRWWRRLDWCDPGEWWYLLKTWLMLL